MMDNCGIPDPKQPVFQFLSNSNFLVIQGVPFKLPLRFVYWNGNWGSPGHGLTTELALWQWYVASMRCQTRCTSS